MKGGLKAHGPHNYPHSDSAALVAVFQVDSKENAAGAETETDE
jgi:hypothetical protein